MIIAFAGLRDDLFAMPGEDKDGREGVGHLVSDSLQTAGPREPTARPRERAPREKGDS